MSARPFLKWVGGKTQLLPELLKRVPAQYRTYHEPFMGGAALFFALRPPRAILSDANQELVSTYQAVRDYVEDVIELLRGYAVDHSEELFYQVRGLDWMTMSDPQIAARMIYLNKTCFNGLYRVNRARQFNVPVGKFKSPPTICDAENLRACSAALAGVRIYHRDFRRAFEDVGPGDFVYCDPPYIPVSATAYFTAFVAGGFTIRHQAQLAEVAENASEHGASVLVSNVFHRLVRELYDGCRFVKVNARRSVNSNAAKRGHVAEYLISWEKT